LPKGLGGNIASRKAGQRFSRKQSQRRLVDRDPLRLEHKARVPAGDRPVEARRVNLGEQ
jgi:hypothetical protein